jgi:polar amino acid transport system permease protein
MWNWTYVSSLLPSLFDGLCLTIWITVLSAVVALGIGLVLTCLRMSRFLVVRDVTTVLVELIRGTPLLVQIFLWYFVLPQVGPVLSPFFTGVIAIGTHYGAYCSEAYRAGIEAVPAGIWEACAALNLKPSRIWARIIWPIALRRSVPSQANYALVIYKETALLFVIGLPVLIEVADAAGNQSYRYLEPLTLAGALYLAVSYPSALLLRKLESRREHSR